MTDSNVGAVSGGKRGRGRPKKAADPHAMPRKCCANCAREVCASGLRPHVRAVGTDCFCVRYVAPGGYRF